MDENKSDSFINEPFDFNLMLLCRPKSLEKLLQLDDFLLALVFLFGADEAIALMRLFGVFVILVCEARDIFSNLRVQLIVQFPIVDGLVHKRAYLLYFLLYLLLAEQVEPLIVRLFLSESQLQVLPHLLYRLILVLYDGRPVESVASVNDLILCDLRVIGIFVGPLHVQLLIHHLRRVPARCNVHQIVEIELALIEGLKTVQGFPLRLFSDVDSRFERKIAVSLYLELLKLLKKGVEGEEVLVKYGEISLEEAAVIQQLENIQLRLRFVPPLLLRDTHNLQKIHLSGKDDLLSLLFLLLHFSAQSYHRLILAFAEGHGTAGCVLGLQPYQCADLLDINLKFIELLALWLPVETFLLQVIKLVNKVSVASQWRICSVNCCLALGVAREHYEWILRITDEHLVPLDPASNPCFCRFFEVQPVLDVFLLEVVEVRTVDVFV